MLGNVIAPGAAPLPEVAGRLMTRPGVWLRTFLTCGWPWSTNVCVLTTFTEAGDVLNVERENVVRVEPITRSVESVGAASWTLRLTGVPAVTATSCSVPDWKPVGRRSRV